MHLLSLSAKVKLIQYIHDKGGTLIGNSAATSETLTRLHFPRFIKTSQWYPARSHLYSPISLGNHLTVKDFPGLLDDIRAKLMWGSLYYYYATPKQPYGTITQHMFPFTPRRVASRLALGPGADRHRRARHVHLRRHAPAARVLVRFCREAHGPDRTGADCREPAGGATGTGRARWP